VIKLNCPCGSGLDINECHRIGIDSNLLRESLKRNIKFDDITKSYRFENIFQPKEMKEHQFTCEILYSIVHTPAGLIVYPLLLTYDKKSIRPLTIDGILPLKDNNNLYTILQCMLTPISSGTILIDMNQAKMNSNKTYKSSCILKVQGNPFSSVFSMENKKGKIALFHHTNEDSKEKIINSKVLKGSRWNFQGTKELDNINYIYLTDLPYINNSFDLMEIGMADKGSKLAVITDDGNVQELTVYRDNPINRTGTLKVWVEAEMIAPNPLILHDIESNIKPGSFGSFSWWELFCPSIYRIPVKNKGELLLEMDSKKKNFFLKRTSDYREMTEFLAGLGGDQESILRLWYEQSAKDVRKNSNITPADNGEIDKDWVEVWSKNASNLTMNLLGNTFSNFA
jgi:hypothetical protein